MINTSSMVGLMILIPPIGLQSDMVGRKTVLGAALMSIRILAYPLIIWTDHGIFSSAVISHLIFAVLIAGVLGPMAATLIEIFPTRIRFSGIGISYNITIAIFGGTAPLVCTWLVSRTGDIESPAHYLIVMAGISRKATLTILKKCGGNRKV